MMENKNEALCVGVLLWKNDWRQNMNLVKYNAQRSSSAEMDVPEPTAEIQAGPLLARMEFRLDNHNAPRPQQKTDMQMM